MKRILSTQERRQPIIRRRRLLQAATCVVVAATAFAAESLAAAPSPLRPLVAAGATLQAAGDQTALDPPGRATPAAVTPQRNFTVVLYGDSLAWEARASFSHAFADRSDVRVYSRTFGGTAICDWLAPMADDAATLRPSVVVVQFSGNNFTQCMHSNAGQPLIGDALVERYDVDASKVVATFAPIGTQVIFAGAPPSAAGTGRDSMTSRINDRYERLATEDATVRYVDSGAAVLADGSWTPTLPCLAWEPCGAGGVNAVRAPDGLHFCPEDVDAASGVTGECPVWSSGAVRFGTALAVPVFEYLDTRPPVSRVRKCGMLPATCRDREQPSP